MHGSASQTTHSTNGTMASRRSLSCQRMLMMPMAALFCCDLHRATDRAPFKRGISVTLDSTTTIMMSYFTLSTGLTEIDKDHRAPWSLSMALTHRTIRMCSTGIRESSPTTASKTNCRDRVPRLPTSSKLLSPSTIVSIRKMMSSRSSSRMVRFDRSNSTKRWSFQEEYLRCTKMLEKRATFWKWKCFSVHIHLYCIITVNKNYHNLT